MVKYRKMNTEMQLYGQKIMHLEKNLQQSKEDLTNCVKEKEEFIYLAAHELKAPLRKISTFTERLSEKSREDLNEEAKKYLNRIEKNVGLMQSLIDGLSMLSEIDADGDLTECDLNILVKKVWERATLHIEEKNVSINISALPVLEGNPEQLKEVFKNLIDNSLRFQQNPGEIKINIQSELLNDEEKSKLNLPFDRVYYKIKFADNGIGFKPEYADQIFEPFQRLNGKSEFPGNGLGLAICKKIVRMHQGILYADVNVNEGSVFVLILPQIRQ
jgi:signal transduction histidine kinase